MAEPKTKPTKASVAAFIDAVENETRRKDAKALLKMFREITGEKPVMWGPTMIGFGTWRSPSGDWPRTAFSPRKAELVLYVLMDNPAQDALLRKLGKHRTGVSCLYIKRLSDVDEGVVRKLISACWSRTEKRHPA